MLCKNMKPCRFIERDQRKQRYTENMSRSRRHDTDSFKRCRLLSTQKEKTWNLVSHFQPRHPMPRLKVLFALLRRPSAWAITHCGPMSVYCIPSRVLERLMGRCNGS